MNYRFLTCLLLASFSTSTSYAQSGLQLPLGASTCSILEALAPKRAAKCRARHLGDTRGIVLRLEDEIKVEQTKPVTKVSTTTKVIPTKTAKKVSKKSVPKIDRAAAKSSNGYFIQFAFASFDLEPDYIDHLDRLATVLTTPAMTSTCIRVTGHTDTIGSDEKNKKLSENRAVMVASYLAEKGNIDPNRILIAAAGEASPLPNILGSDPLNRRVEFSTKEANNGCA